mgnify:CR=1 FL=1
MAPPSLLNPDTLYCVDGDASRSLFVVLDSRSSYIVSAQNEQAYLILQDQTAQEQHRHCKDEGSE